MDYNKTIFLPLIGVLSGYVIPLFFEDRFSYEQKFFFSLVFSIVFLSVFAVNTIQVLTKFQHKIELIKKDLDISILKVEITKNYYEKLIDITLSKSFDESYKQPPQIFNSELDDANDE